MMKISDAVKTLVKLKEQHGDVQIQADCPFCGKGFPCDLVVAAPVTVVLQNLGGTTMRCISGKD